MWKPKLRIPDIYENRLNQVAFGNFLDILYSRDNPKISGFDDTEVVCD